MLSSLKSTLKPLALTIGAGGLIFATYEAIGFVVSVDALNRYRDKGGPKQETPGAEMLDAHFNAFAGTRLVTEADVRRLTMSQNRSIAQLEGITNGRYYNEKGDNYQYSATTATYQYFRKQLEIDAGGRFWGRDVDITAPAISLNRLLQQVEAPGQFTGKLSGGMVAASNLFYNLRSGSWRAGPVEWKGVVQGQEAGPKKTVWNVKGDLVESDGDLMHYTKGYATDGEVIVRADKIDHNRKTDVLTATGNVKYFGIDANMTCPKATVFRKESRAVFEGGVNMLVKPKGGVKPEESEIPPLTPYVPEEIQFGRPLPPKEQKSANDQLRNTENLRSYPTSVIAQRVEYWYKKGARHAVITGAPQARQEITGVGWRMVWGKSATWDGETDWLVVKSSEGSKDARLKMSNGDDFKALQFEILAKEDSKSWKGKEAEGVFNVDDEETTGGGGGTTGGAPPPTLSGPIGG